MSTAHLEGRRARKGSARRVFVVLLVTVLGTPLGSGLLAAQQNRPAQGAAIWIVTSSGASETRGMTWVVGARDANGPASINQVANGRGYLGVRGLDLTDELREHFGAPSGRGVMVAALDPRGPAGSCGLAVGDIIVAVDGQIVDSEAGLATLIRPHGSGDQVVLSVLRDGEATDLQASLSERPRPLIRLARDGSTVRVHVLRDLASATGALPQPAVYVEDALAGLQRLVRQGGADVAYQGLPVERIDRRLLDQRIRQLERRLDELQSQLARAVEDAGSESR